MTVNNAASRITYPGNGSTTVFTFPMAVPDANSIDVFVTDATGAIRQLNPIEFSVGLNPLVGANPTVQGGSVTYNPGGTPLPLGQFITIVRDLDPIQDTSISNQSIVYPPVIEQEFDYLTMLIQQGGTDFSRSIKVPPTDPPPADLPPLGLRANQQAFFDANGNMVAGAFTAPGVVVSAAMQPVVSAATLALAQTAFGLNKDPRVITGSYVLVPDDDRRLIVAQGAASYLITAADFSTYPTYFRAIIINNDTRAKVMNIFGYPGQFKIYPDQQVLITRTATSWLISRPGRWQPLTAQNFYVDPVLGNDNNDGLAVGAGAFATIAKAVSVLETDVDGDFTINLSDANHNVGTGVILSKRLTGGTSYKITGNLATPSNVNINMTAGNTCFSIINGAVATIRGMQFNSSSPTSNGVFLNVVAGGILNFGNVVFGALAAGIHVQCFSSVVNVIGNYTIGVGASANIHIACYYNSVYMLSPPGFGPVTITLLGAVQFVNGFYYCLLNGTVISLGATYVNAGFAVGTPKATVVYNAIVNAGGAAIPGDQPANVSNGGFFF